MSLFQVCQQKYLTQCEGLQKRHDICVTLITLNRLDTMIGQLW